MIGKFPAKLLDHLIGEGLGTFGIVRTQVDVYKAPTVSICNFRAESVHLVIVAMYGENFGIVNRCAKDFASFEIGGNEYATFQACMGGDRGGGVG